MAGRLLVMISKFTALKRGKYIVTLIAGRCSIYQYLGNKTNLVHTYPSTLAGFGAAQMILIYPTTPDDAPRIEVWPLDPLFCEWKSGRG
jgi:hypothetical protein